MREHWSWPGAVALVLAVMVAGGWCAAIVLAASPIGENLSEQSTSLLTTIGGVLAGALATFLGAAMEQRRGARDIPPPPPHETEPHDGPTTPYP